MITPGSLLKAATRLRRFEVLTAAGGLFALAGAIVKWGFDFRTLLVACVLVMAALMIILLERVVRLTAARATPIALSFAWSILATVFIGIGLLVSSSVIDQPFPLKSWAARQINGTARTTPPALWDTPFNTVPVDFRWMDIKWEDVTAQGGGISIEDQKMERNRCLWCLRGAIQRALYDAGDKGDTTTPSTNCSPTIEQLLQFADKIKGLPENDTGQGHMEVGLYPNESDGRWKIRAQGWVREFRRKGESNNELWSARLWSQERFSQLKQGQKLDLQLELMSRVESPKNLVTFHFSVSADTNFVWRSCDDDIAYFGRTAGRGQTRLFVEPNDLAVTACGTGRVHVATVIWK